MVVGGGSAVSKKLRANHKPLFSWETFDVTMSRQHETCSKNGYSITKGKEFRENIFLIFDNHTMKTFLGILTYYWRILCWGDMVTSNMFPQYI